MASSENVLELVVGGREDLAKDVIGLTFTHPEGHFLPEWSPGAHIDLVLDGGIVRQYSLCSDPRDRDHYKIAVLREPESRGGSVFVHDRLSVGDRVQVIGPRNNFELSPAPTYLFIAGGIGITPILPMLGRAEAEGATWRLVYGGRHRDSMAFADRLTEQYGERVELAPADETGLLDLATLVDSVQVGELIYCCGPEPLLGALEQRCSGRLPEGSRLHVERFVARTMERDQPESAIEVTLSRSGINLTVPPEASILEKAEEAGVQVTTSCEQGICGSCETKVISGTPDHRDDVLDEEEKAENTSMMICVSRALTKELELDL